MRPSVTLALILTILGGCSTPVVKPEGMDPSVVAASPRRADAAGRDLRDAPIRPGSHWLRGLDPRRRLMIAGLREGGATVPCLVLELSPDEDRLELLPLPPGEHPAAALLDPARKEAMRTLVRDHARGRALANIRTLDLASALREARLGSPLPTPTAIYAVAANYPSHLEEDLALGMDAERRRRLATARARVFRKYPPVPAPGSPAPSPFRGVVGPFDDLRAPATLAVPTWPDDPADDPPATRLDYEVEVGVVIGRRLLPEDASDERRLREAIAGVVLVSDAKARNPQVVTKVGRRDEPPSRGSAPYRFGDEDLDDALGAWDAFTCHWWSYAASWGDYAALGPFLVEEAPGEPLTERALITARSYGPEAARGQELPAGHEPDRFYLRQASRLSESEAARDGLIWRATEVMRSILATDRNALAFDGAAPVLEVGDVVALGTPAGCVITARSQGLFDFISTFLATWSPRDWHDFFFDGDAELYLHPGDRVFFWAEGLGYQVHSVERAEAPGASRGP